MFPNEQHVEYINIYDILASPSSLSPTPTSNKPWTFQDLYDHTNKLDALIADHNFETENFLILGTSPLNHVRRF